MPRSYASAIIDADPEEVWRFIRNFDRTPDYLQLVEHSEITGGQPADRVGCERVMTLTDGSVVKETLIAIDDELRELRYHLTEAPFPFTGYYSTMRVYAITTTGGTFVAWSSTYDCESADADANDDLLAGQIYSPGLSSIKGRFETTGA
jgi:hypothetical protein